MSEEEEEVRQDDLLGCEDAEQGGTRLLGGVFPSPSYLVATVEGGWGELDCSQNVKRSLQFISQIRQAKLEPKGPRVRGEGKESIRTGRPPGVADTKRPLSLRACGPMTTMVAS